MRGLWLASVLLGCTLPDPATEGVDEWVKLDTDPDDDGAWSWGEEISVDRADASVIGESAKNAQWPMALVGDVNGDGIDDVTLGCALSESSPNRVYMLYGRRDGWALDQSLSTTSSIAGSDEDGLDGWAVRVGDVNGDGLADVGIAGGWGHEYLMLGSPDPWPVELPLDEVDVVAQDDAAIAGTVGNEVRQRPAVGDVDGDGLDDWLLIRDYDNGGEAWVLSGAALSGDVEFPGDDVALSVQAGALGSQAAPMSFQPVGDITGDGLSDLGGFASDGTFHVVAGTSAPAEGLEVGVASSAQFELDDSMKASSVGDLDHDGIDDLAISSRTEGISVFFGGPHIAGIVTTDQRDVLLAPGFGASEIETVGDLNGDGLRELAFLIEDASMPESSDVVVYFGRSDWPEEIDLDDADIRIRGTSGEERFWLSSFSSFSSSMIGDIDGDGIDELFLSAPSENWGGVSGAGTVRVFRGRTDWPPEIDRDDPDLLIHGSVSYEQLGFYGNFDVTDINGDGADDMLTSTAWYDDTGAVFLFFGHPTP